MIAGAIGAAAGLVGQVAADVVTSIQTGEVHVSSFTEYAGAAVGGAVGKYK